MSDSIVGIYLAILAVSVFVGLALLGGVIGLWWPLRSAGVLRALPWFLLALVFSRVAETVGSYLTAKYISDLSGSMTEASRLLAMWTMMLEVCWGLLCWVLVMGNTAYLLDRVGHDSGLIRFFKRAYDLTPVWGIGLMLVAILSGAKMWIIARVPGWSGS